MMFLQQRDVLFAMIFFCCFMNMSLLYYIRSSVSSLSAYRTFICAGLMYLLMGTNVFGQHLQLSGGLALPNEGISSFFDAANFTSGSSAYQAIQNAVKSGFHVQARYLLDVGDRTSVALSAGYNSFAQGKATITSPTLPAGINIAMDYSQNVIPLGVGLDYHLLKSFMGLVLMGELNYNLINYSVNQQVSSVPIPVPIQFGDKSYNRVGFSTGIGFRLDVKLLTLTVDARYHFANLIGREANELERRFVTISAGFLF